MHLSGSGSTLFLAGATAAEIDALEAELRGLVFRWQASGFVGIGDDARVIRTRSCG